MTTRAEWLSFCKQRALEYVDAGLLVQAIASMGSDLNKHPETRSLVSFPPKELIYGSTEELVRNWIVSFR